MNNHEQDQCDGHRDMDCEPGVQPDVQTRLDIELPALFTQIGQPVDNLMSLGSKAGLEHPKERCSLDR
jgi:hypothetical protein